MCWPLPYEGRWHGYIMYDQVVTVHSTGSNQLQIKRSHQGIQITVMDVNLIDNANLTILMLTHE